MISFLIGIDNEEGYQYRLKKSITYIPTGDRRWQFGEESTSFPSKNIYWCRS